MLWKEAFSSQTAFHATALAYTRRCFVFPFENRRAPDRSERGARERGPPSPYTLAVNNPPGFYFHSRSMISKWPKKNYLYSKKFSTWCIMLKKISHLYMSKFYLQRFGETNSYSNQNTHSSPLQKSNG